MHVFVGPLADAWLQAAATDDDVRAALGTVDALTWADALSDGLATLVGEGSHRLTGAQRQPLALARLVPANPAVAVLAEAGSVGPARWNTPWTAPSTAGPPSTSPTASPHRQCRPPEGRA
ncbi:hypothetical protein AB0L65_16820 [Nonomuraea sp. NPDC052116]|uniref:hypothetical protein n=1 Tax=Nonomuraea sp. NPDC052116 TaxID=3155665 RepID=UPI00343C292B